MKKLLGIVVLGLLLSSNAIGIEIELKNKDYVEIEGDLKNPDRGWYYQIGAEHQTVESHTIFTQRNISLYRLYFSLKNFRDKPIDEITLKRFEDILVRAEEIKVKMIPQFYYHWGSSKNSKVKKLNPGAIKNNKWISPPEELILKHVEQISEIINKNKDGISYIHAGFLGSWGEWHSDQYGDGHKLRYKKFRKKLIIKLLEELDDDIFIALRYPSDHVNMKDLPGYERLGLHHDCPNYRSDIYPKYRAHKLVVNAPMDGETCEIKSKSAYSCKIMTKYFKKYQFDSHNESNWSGAILRYAKEGCFDEIEKKLGYRFVIKGSKYKDDYIYFKVANVGWGKSFKSRGVSIKIKDKIFKSDIDIKNWKPGNEYIEKIYVGKQKVEFGTLIIEEEVKFANTTGNKIFFY